jgi:serine phosphatase RsbU (regulator of sigma subunit)
MAVRYLVVSQRCRSTKHQLNCGAANRLLLFTDGLTEAVNKIGEQFGEERLIELLRTYRDRSANEMKHTIFEVVGKFVVNHSKTMSH